MDGVRHGSKEQAEPVWPPWMSERRKQFSADWVGMRSVSQC